MNGDYRSSKDFILRLNAANNDISSAEFDAWDSFSEKASAEAGSRLTVSLQIEAAAGLNRSDGLGACFCRVGLKSGAGPVGGDSRQQTDRVTGSGPTVTGFRLSTFVLVCDDPVYDAVVVDLFNLPEAADSSAEFLGRAEIPVSTVLLPSTAASGTGSNVIRQWFCLRKLVPRGTDDDDEEREGWNLSGEPAAAVDPHGALLVRFCAGPYIHRHQKDELILRQDVAPVKRSLMKVKVAEVQISPVPSTTVCYGDGLQGVERKDVFAVIELGHPMTASSISDDTDIFWSDATATRTAAVVGPQSRRVTHSTAIQFLEPVSTRVHRKQMIFCALDHSLSLHVLDAELDSVVVSVYAGKEVADKSHEVFMGSGPESQHADSWAIKSRGAQLLGRCVFPVRSLSHRVDGGGRIDHWFPLLRESRPDPTSSSFVPKLHLVFGYGSAVRDAYYDATGPANHDILTGWLFKKSTKNRWNRRWAVLQRRGRVPVLLLFRDQPKFASTARTTSTPATSASLAVGELCLVSANCLPAKDPTNGSGLYIDLRDSVRVHLHFQSNAEANSWYVAIRHEVEGVPELWYDDEQFQLLQEKEQQEKQQQQQIKSSNLNQQQQLEHKSSVSATAGSPLLLRRRSKSISRSFVADEPSGGRRKRRVSSGIFNAKQQPAAPTDMLEFTSVPLQAKTDGDGGDDDRQHPAKISNRSRSVRSSRFLADVNVLAESEIHRLPSVNAEIGRGHFGRVWAGLLWGHYPVAVKELIRTRQELGGNGSDSKNGGGAGSDQRSRDQFVREAQALSRIPLHENVVKFVGVVWPKKPGSAPWLVTEFVAEGTLHEWLRGRSKQQRKQRRLIAKALEQVGSRGDADKHSAATAAPVSATTDAPTPDDPDSLTGEMLCGVLAGIAEGMSFLHASDIIHRDLAARNILVSVTSDGRLLPKIADFGLARVLERDRNRDRDRERDRHTINNNDNNMQQQEQSTFQSLDQQLWHGDGALRWLAPECLKERDYSKASDIWSFGVLLAEVTTRRKPYPDITNPMVVAQRVAAGVLKPTVHVNSSVVLKALLNQCCRNGPRARITFDDVADRLAGESSIWSQQLVQPFDWSFLRDVRKADPPILQSKELAGEDGDDHDPTAVAGGTLSLAGSQQQLTRRSTGGLLLRPTNNSGGGALSATVDDDETESEITYAGLDALEGDWEDEDQWADAAPAAPATDNSRSDDMPVESEAGAGRQQTETSAVVTRSGQDIRDEEEPTYLGLGGGHSESLSALAESIRRSERRSRRLGNEKPSSVRLSQSSKSLSRLVHFPVGLDGRKTRPPAVPAEPDDSKASPMIPPPIPSDPDSPLTARSKAQQQRRERQQLAALNRQRQRDHAKQQQHHHQQLQEKKEVVAASVSGRSRSKSVSAYSSPAAAVPSLPVRLFADDAVSSGRTGNRLRTFSMGGGRGRGGDASHQASSPRPRKTTTRDDDLLQVPDNNIRPSNHRLRARSISPPRTDAAAAEAAASRHDIVVIVQSPRHTTAGDDGASPDPSPRAWRLRSGSKPVLLQGKAAEQALAAGSSGSSKNRSHLLAAKQNSPRGRELSYDDLLGHRRGSTNDDASESEWPPPKSAFADLFRDQPKLTARKRSQSAFIAPISLSAVSSATGDDNGAHVRRGRSPSAAAVTSPRQDRSPSPGRSSGRKSTVAEDTAALVRALSPRRSTGPPSWQSSPSLLTDHMGPPDWVDRLLHLHFSKQYEVVRRELHKLDSTQKHTFKNALARAREHRAKKAKAAQEREKSGSGRRSLSPPPRGRSQSLSRNSRRLEKKERTSPRPAGWATERTDRSPRRL